jgi:hypothetical protein
MICQRFGGDIAPVPAQDQFNRRETPTGQTREIALEQVRSREIWGRVPRNNGMEPTVQAYTGLLDKNMRGIEFTTDIPPHNNGSPIEERLYLYRTPGVESRRMQTGEEVACILATSVKNCQP